jgi:hypothetical protein
MHVVPNAPLPVARANRVGQQLADRIEQFLTSSFAIPRERLSLQVTRPPSTGEGPAAPPPGSLRWRVEVFRLA